LQLFEFIKNCQSGFKVILEQRIVDSGSLKNHNQRTVCLVISKALKKWTVSMKEQ
jgi:hypothetical protein